MYERVQRLVKPRFFGATVLVATLSALSAEAQGTTQERNEFFTFGKVSAEVSTLKGEVRVDPDSVEPTIDEVLAMIGNTYGPILPVPIPESVISDARETLSSELATLNQSGSWTEGGATVELGAGMRFDTPRWQREVVASLLAEVTSNGAFEYSGIQVCGEAIGSHASVGIEACARSSDEGIQSSVTLLKGLFSDENHSARFAVGGKVLTGGQGTEQSALVRARVPQVPARLEFEYTKIPQGEILGQSYEGGEWQEVRALIGAGAWNMLGSGRRDEGLSVSLGYKKFKVDAPVEGSALVNVPEIPFANLPSRTFKIPTTGKAHGEGRGFTVEAKYRF